MRIGLVQPPPLNADRPSIGLSIMASVAEGEGHDVDLVYSNLHCAHALGDTVYRDITQGPNDGLIPDIAFVRAYKPDTSLEQFMSIVDDRMGSVTDTQRLRYLLTQSAEDMRSFLDHEIDRLLLNRYDVIGFTVVFSLFPSVVMAKLLRDRGFRGTIIFGGSHCEGPMGIGITELVPEVDFVVRGYAERSFPILLKHIAEGGGPAKIPGAVARGEKGPLIGPPAGLLPMDDIPFVSYDRWFAERDGLGMGTPSSAWVPLETARGCWYGEVKQCTFCGLNGEQMRFTSKSPERALKEFTAIAEQGAHQVYMTDPILERAYFKSLLPQLAEKELPLSIFYEVKSNIDDGEVRLLADAGVRAIQPGIESLSSHVLSLMQKGVRAYQNVRLLVSAARHGVGVGWNLLYGFSGETEEDYAQMSELIPLMYHLEPPGIGDGSGGWVRMDRFSPMHDNPKEHGLTNARPHAVFEELWRALGVDPKKTNAVAWASYYFDFDYIDGRGADQYLGDVMEKLRTWHAQYGRVLLTGTVRDGRMYIIDSRTGTEASHVLDVVSTSILDRSMEGISRGRLLKALVSHGHQESEVDLAITSLITNGWLVDLDNRLVSLVVRLDHSIPTSLPEVLLWPALKFTAQQRHASRRAIDDTTAVEEVKV